MAQPLTYAYPEDNARGRRGDRTGTGGSGTESALALEEEAWMDRAHVVLRREEAIWRGRHGEERRRRMHGAGCDGSGTGQERAAGAGERKPHMSALGRSGLGENAME
jgi:hypothetical protein